MDTAILDKQTSDKVSFITYIIPKFADAYKMNVQDAFFYLKKYGFRVKIATIGFGDIFRDMITMQCLNVFRKCWLF